MISDETFPMISDIEEDDQLYNTATTNGDTFASTETFETSRNSSGVGTSATDISSVTNPVSADSTEKTDFFEANELSFVSMPAKKLTLHPPSQVTIRQKKSLSCHDLQQRKPNYDYVESVVRKQIQRNSMSSNVDIEERRRKMLSRHKSMPLSPQQPLDETFSDDPVSLKQALRRKSIQVYELLEANNEKDTRIYSLEYEKSKMRMTFDKLRVEMHELKEKERDYRHILATSPPMKMLRNTATQTESNAEKNVSHIRELTFNETPVFLNQTHFSELNNASSDNLILEVALDEINNITRTMETHQDVDDPQEEQKKKKKFHRFFKLMSCVSK